ncbi:MAG: lipoprotein-releasing ABC transporter permease subunit [Desulfobacterales bacterium]
MSFEYFISQRFLRVKQKEAFVSLITFLSIAGVAVGVMALIVVIAVMSGAEIDIRDRILGIQSHMVLMHYGEPITDVDAVINRVEDTENVVAATPLVHTQAMLRSSSGIAGAIIRGIDPESAGKVTETLDKIASSLTPTLQTGNPSTLQATPRIVLGKGLAMKLTAAKGDVIYMISSGAITGSEGNLPTRKRFVVADIFSSGMHEYDQTMAYIHIRTAQEMLRLNDGVNLIAIRLEAIFEAKETAERINAKLGFPFWVRDWMQMNQNLFSALKLQKAVMFIILTLIVLVAAFNIASALIMMVMEKTRGIAILKTMGATNRSLIKIFVYGGLTIGAVGTILGVCLGSILCAILKQYHFIELPEDVYYFTTLPVMLEPSDVLIIASATLVLCFLASLYPAIKASRLNPVDGIRYG